MTKEDILNTLQQAKDYADRAVDSANEAEIEASQAHTQAIEAHDMKERAKWRPGGRGKKTRGGGGVRGRG